MQAAPGVEFIFDDAPFASCHASTVVELANGDVMSAWFGGSAEGNADVAIWSSLRSGEGWSPPLELAWEPNIACYNPVLFYSGDGLLWLYYKFGPHPDRWTAARRSSTDHGATWSAVEHLPAGLYGPVRTKPLVMPDGAIVSGTSVETYRSWACWIERSIDHGKAWEKFGPITIAPDASRTPVSGDAPPAVPGSEEWALTDGIIQPSVVSLGGNHLRLYARSTSRTGKVCIADSIDGGIRWTGSRTTLLNCWVLLRRARYSCAAAVGPRPHARRRKNCGRTGEVYALYGSAAKLELQEPWDYNRLPTWQWRRARQDELVFDAAGRRGAGDGESVAIASGDLSGFRMRGAASAVLWAGAPGGQGFCGRTRARPVRLITSPV